MQRKILYLPQKTVESIEYSHRVKCIVTDQFEYNYFAFSILYKMFKRLKKKIDIRQLITRIKIGGERNYVE